MTSDTGEAEEAINKSGSIPVGQGTFRGIMIPLLKISAVETCSEGQEKERQNGGGVENRPVRGNCYTMTFGLYNLKVLHQVLWWQTTFVVCPKHPIRDEKMYTIA